MEDAEFADRAVFLPAADALVLADLHLGKDATSAVSLPLGEREDLTTRLDALLDRFSPAEVVLAGDVFHAFDRVPDDAAGTFSALREGVERADAELVAVRGNHDSMLDSAVDPYDEYRLADGTVVCHGHEEPEASAPRYVAGHDHPAITIEGRKRPCYLWGPDAYRGADALVLPAFTRLARGTAINGTYGGEFGSALVARVGDFSPVVRDEEADETYRFPPLSEFRRML